MNILLIVIAVIAVLVGFDRVAFWQVVMAGFVIGTTQSTLQPVRFTLLMDLVVREQLPSANALASAAHGLPLFEKPRPPIVRLCGHPRASFLRRTANDL